MYGNADAYVEEFTASLDAIIAEGFLLEADRAELIADAEAIGCRTAADRLSSSEVRCHFAQGNQRPIGVFPL